MTLGCSCSVEVTWSLGVTVFLTPELADAPCEALAASGFLIFKCLISFYRSFSSVLISYVVSVEYLVSYAPCVSTDFDKVWNSL